MNEGQELEALARPGKELLPRAPANAPPSALTGLWSPYYDTSPLGENSFWHDNTSTPVPLPQALVSLPRWHGAQGRQYPLKLRKSSQSVPSSPGILAASLVMGLWAW